MRILLVEDDPAVRHVVEAALLRNGFQVLAAPSPVEASALLLDMPATPDVALLDIKLPGLSGIEYGDHLRKRFPAVRLVFMTGWLDDTTRLEAAARGTLLEKPFTFSALTRVLG